MQFSGASSKISYSRFCNLVCYPRDMDNSGTQSVWLEAPGGQRTPVRGSCFLGRSAACEVVIANAKASRQHALIHGQQERGFWLTDLGSANGTFLNGRRVGQPCRLSDGDVISIAEVALTFIGPKAPPRLTADSAMARPTIVEVRHLTCWLLIADIEDSTQLLRELSPEEATGIIGRWLSACAKIIDQQQGDLDKFLGDGFLAYWLAGNSAAASVVAALAALKTLQEAADLPFRMVLHYAQVSSAAPMGGESLSGKEVNFVFRLEKLAGRLRQRRLLSEPARAAINPLLPSTFNGRYALQGFVGEFPVYCF